MRQIYFSCSWQDRPLNEYFLDLFASSELELIGDRESRLFCVPKLERFVCDSHGLLAVVPARRTESPAAPYSQYIEVEIKLALRAGMPHLIFVDDSIVEEFCNRIDADVVPFRRAAPAVDQSVHVDLVEQFCAELANGPQPARLRRNRRLRNAAVFRDANCAQQTEGLKGIEELLKKHAYTVRTYAPDDVGQFVSSARAHKILRSVELAVFFLEPGVGGLEGLAWLADALGVPKFRLLRDASQASDEAMLDGTIVWVQPDQLISVFREHFESYRLGSSRKLLRGGGTYGVPPGDEWALESPESLNRFVEVKDPFLENDLREMPRLLGGRADFAGLASEGQFEALCNAAYDQIQGHGWVYDYERASPNYERQVIRTPEVMFRDQKGCCLDFACLFAALLESMHVNPVILRICGDRFAHAVAGCWKGDHSERALIRDSQAVKDLVESDEILIFETTGAARANRPTAGEPKALRKAGNGFLSFEQATETARNLVLLESVEVDFLLDVVAARENAMPKP
ncbi:MAG: transglutaminase-like domain-containing protein [Planctomycetota bacterium]